MTVVVATKCYNIKKILREAVAQPVGLISPFVGYDHVRIPWKTSSRTVAYRRKGLTNEMISPTGSRKPHLDPVVFAIKHKMKAKKTGSKSMSPNH